jgi:hypothetical protein
MNKTVQNIDDDLQTEYQSISSFESKLRIVNNYLKNQMNSLIRKALFSFKTTAKPIAVCRTANLVLRRQKASRWQGRSQEAR